MAYRAEPSQRDGDATRPPEGGRVAIGTIAWVVHQEHLPAIELVGSRALTPANGESDDPKDEEDKCGNPQQVDCETRSKENQHKQQCQNQYHRTTSLLVKPRDLVLPNTSNQLDGQRSPGHLRPRSDDVACFQRPWR